MPFQLKRVLVPVSTVDETDQAMARAAIEAAATLAAPHQAQLTVMTALPPVGHASVAFSSAAMDGLTDLRNQALGRAQRVLDELAAEAKAAGCDATTKLSTSDARVAKQIVKEAEDGGFDLVVIPSHGRRGVQLLLLGSVAQAVAQECKVPVLLLAPEKV